MRCVGFLGCYYFVTSLCSLNQTHATHPLFLDNLHSEHFVAGVNLSTRWNYLTKSSKWRLSKKRGWVAYVCPKRRFWKSERTFGNAFSKHFSKERSPNRVLTLWKVLRKCVPKRSFGHPKSSFGEHKVCKMITKDSSNMWCDVLGFLLFILLDRLIRPWTSYPFSSNNSHK